MFVRLVVCSMVSPLEIARVDLAHRLVAGTTGGSRCCVGARGVLFPQITQLNHGSGIFTRHRSWSSETQCNAALANSDCTSYITDRDEQFLRFCLVYSEQVKTPIDSRFIAAESLFHLLSVARGTYQS
jgi:hypothetical protein